MQIRDLTPYRRHGYVDSRFYSTNTSSPLVAPVALEGNNYSAAFEFMASPRIAGQSYTDGLFDLANGSTDFCLEGYALVPVPAVPGRTSTIFFGPGNTALTVDGSGNFRMINGGGNTGSAPPCPANSRFHWTYYRLGGTCRVAVEGQIIWAFGNGASGRSEYGVGHCVYGTSPNNFVFSQLKATLGNARYGTSNFTPPGSGGLGFNSTDDALWASVVFASDFVDPALTMREVGRVVLQTAAQVGTLPVPPANRQLGKVGLPTLASFRTATSAPEYTGNFKIVGIVNVDDDPDYPVARRVRLYTQDNGRFVAETWSQEGTGFYIFDYIRGDRKYFITAEDYNHLFNAVINDNVSPEPR